MPHHCDGTPTAAEEGHARILELEDMVKGLEKELSDEWQENVALRKCLEEIQDDRSTLGWVYCKIRDVLNADHEGSIQG